MTNLVIDNSAAVKLAQGEAGLGDGDRTFYAPQLIDLEFANTLRKLVLRHEIDQKQAGAYLAEWASNSLIRCAHTMLLPRIWRHRDNITAYDAAYVARAELLEIPLVTADHRLSNAAAEFCPDVVVD
jgi:predicted nucleic acid-binding protein